MSSGSLYQAVLNSLDEQIALIDSEGTIIYVNRAWRQFGIDNGIPAEYEPIGANYLKVCSTETGDGLWDEVLSGIQKVSSGELDCFYHEYPCHGPRERRWFVMRATPLQGGSRSLLVISHHNVTQRKLAEERAEHLARHDALTGLPNRLHFAERLENEWRRSLRERTPISLVMLDVDHFKDYNDEFGHPTGDRCLKDVGRVLTTFSNRASDIAVRYGGEEFAVIFGQNELY